MFYFKKVQFCINDAFSIMFIFPLPGYVKKNKVNNACIVLNIYLAFTDKYE